MNQVKKLLIVGGGTAGLISAIIIKKYLSIQVDIVHSKNIGIIGVGEGSTEHFRQFMDFAGIDQHTIIKECDATFKSGIMFSGWGDKDYLHSVGGGFEKKAGQYPFVYAKQVGENTGYLNPRLLWNNRIDKYWLNKNETPPFNQFHFNTHKLNAYLIKVAKSLGINVMEDDIQDINLDEAGNIKSLTGVTSMYEYDFYIDSTGFKRILMSKLGANWVSYGKYLKMKSAITFQTSDTDEYNLWTVAKAMDYGWLFRIPVWGRYGNGYIFDSDYIDADTAKAEVDKLFNGSVEVGKQFNFDPGALDRQWIKNCCAIGLSSSFIEPLEASSIGTSIQQSFILMHKLANYDESVIKSYNKSITEITDNIRDFVVLHYVTKKTNTSFWKDVSALPLPDSLASKLEVWRNRMPITEDFIGQSGYSLFGPSNYIMVMDGLDLFNRDAIKQELELHNEDIKKQANTIVDDEIKRDLKNDSFSHKEYLSLIRNYL